MTTYAAIFEMRFTRPHDKSVRPAWGSGSLWRGMMRKRKNTERRIGLLIKDLRLPNIGVSYQLTVDSTGDVTISNYEEVGLESPFRKAEEARHE